MKKILFVVICLLYGVAYGQVCADEDTVRSNAVTLITANTVRVNGTVSHFSGAPTSLQLRYVRVGQTDTATSSSVPTTALRNLTGLQAATQYYYYYKTICGSGSVSQTIGAYTFTTLANTVLYAPERPTVFNHLKVDSSFIVPEGDTVVGREPSTRAQIRYKTSDNTFYGYYTDCTCWRALAIDSSGIIGLLDGKVDSVTVSGDSLFYWKVGVSYGYILPSVATVWHTTGNTGIDTSTDFIGTTDNVDFPIKTNNVRRFTVNTSGALGIGATPDYGTSGYLFQSGGSGAAPAWVDGNGLYSNKALSNLSSVAINTSLLPGTSASINLGSIAKNWKNFYLSGTTSSTDGIIYRNGETFIHSYQAPGTDGDNTFIGYGSGSYFNLSGSGVNGSYNLGVGTVTLRANTTGSRNTAVGTYAMQNNTTGVNNTVVGQNALATNTTGYNNAVLGVRAAAFGSPHDIAAVGVDAASRTNNATYISALGTDAYYNAYNSLYGVAIGDSTLWKDSTGIKNTAVGSRAGYYLGDTYPNFSTQKDNYMTFLGADASRDSSVYHQTGLSNSTAIGYNAKVSASNQVVIGNDNVTTTLLKGSVGIGTSAPDSTLHVVGGFKYANGSQGSGKYLTSDANGGATWGTISTGLTVGTTSIASGTDTKVLYNNAGTLGEYTISGTGNVAMTTNASFTTPALGTPSALVGTNITGTGTGFTAGAVNNALSIGAELISGGATTYNGSAAKTLGIQATSVTNAMLAGSIAASKLVGTDIATVGTITTGTWNATPIPDNRSVAYQLLGSTIVAESLYGSLAEIQASTALVDRTAHFIAVYIPKSQTITGVKWFQVVQGNYTANNYNGVGLYSYSGGTLTLVASSTDDGAIWKATASTMSSKAFSSTYAASPGIYFVGLLYCRSAETAAPTIGNFYNGITNHNNGDFTNSAKLSGTLNSQTTLPASQAMSGVTVSSLNRYVALY